MAVLTGPGFWVRKTGQQIRSDVPCKRTNEVLYRIHTIHILYTPYSVYPEIRGGSELTSKSHRGKASGRSGRGP